MKVYYGIGKINKVKKKREISILYENTESFRFREGKSYQDRFVAKSMHLAYVRKQTKAEEADAINSERTFTAYSIFIDEKPFNGSLEKALIHNYKAEINNLSKAELQRIYDSLEKAFLSAFPEYKKEYKQLELQF